MPNSGGKYGNKKRNRYDSIHCSRFNQTKKEEIYEKVTTGKTEDKIQTGGNSFSKKEWEKLIGRVDKVEDKAKEDIEEKKKQEVDKSLNERNAAYEKMSVKASVTKEKTVKSKQDVLELL